MMTAVYPGVDGAGRRRWWWTSLVRSRPRCCPPSPEKPPPGHEEAPPQIIPNHAGVLSISPASVRLMVTSPKPSSCPEREEPKISVSEPA